MKIAVTGATGFIGRHVIQELSKYSADVVCLGRSALQSQPGKSKLRHYGLDLNDYPANLYQELGEPDILIHLAWSGLDDFNSADHIERELPLHEVFLEDMLRAGLPSLLVAGTCLEYGMQRGGLAETAGTKPVTVYGMAKNSLRQRLQRIQEEYPFKLCWSRLFYLYGDGQAPNCLLPQLKEAVASKSRVFNMSKGDQQRDYLPVERVAAILVALAQILADKDIGVVNVCSGRPISVIELVQSWLTEYNWPIELNPGYYPYPDYEPMAFWGDRSKLDRVLMGTSVV